MIPSPDCPHCYQSQYCFYSNHELGQELLKRIATLRDWRQPIKGQC